ncbi:MAG TPA: glycosyltransferase family 9 protein [Syntrophales bacterium]|nr:glycosyltransferase family 9 protein [Syntrophobacterales bacterium]HQL90836.1 glycosyltransferase family 9 protein [Syntrophales bacterium]
MDVGLQRKIDQAVGPLICRALSIFRGTRPPAAVPERILIILLSEMGSLVLGSSMFRRLREKYPHASIHALVFEKNREILDLLDVIPPENVMTLCDRSLGGLAGDSLAAIRKMRNLRFDVVIDCELFARVSGIFSWFSGAPVRVGFHRHTMEGLYRGDFINRPVLYNPYRHISDQFLALVDAIESSTVPKNKFEAYDGVPKEAPAMRLREGEQQETEKRLYGDFPAIRGRKLVLLYPSGGILPIRAWPLESFCATAGSLVERGFAVAVIGMPEDKSLARTIQEHCRSPLCVDLTGYTKSIRDLLVIFHFASLLITNDGGPGQFAVMTPIRSILLFGPETPALYGPNSPRAKVFFSGIACSPCLTAYNHRNSPCDGDNRCLKVITPEAVLACALEMLGKEAVR